MRTRLIKHSLQLGLVHVFPVPNLVQIGFDINVCRQEENVVDYVTNQ